MCGRFTLPASPAELLAYFQLKEAPAFEPRYNIAPSQEVATVRVECVFRPNPATIPTGKRPLFRRESGQHSDSIPSTIPEQSGQCDVRV